MKITNFTFVCIKGTYITFNEEEGPVYIEKTNTVAYEYVSNPRAIRNINLMLQDTEYIQLTRIDYGGVIPPYFINFN